MDAVVLAAGKNQRLWSSVMPFHKPLVEVDGTPLVVNIVQALQAHHGVMDGFEDQHARRVDRIVVVCAPENTLKIRDALQAAGCLRSNLRLVVQPVADGAANGLIAGLEACRTGRVLVICGDNIVPQEDLLSMIEQPGSFAVMFKMVSEIENAARLTRITEGGRFLDRIPRKTDLPAQCWLGPLVVPRSRMLIHLNENERTAGVREPSIQDALNALGGIPALVEGNCFDIGTPEALKEVM